MTESKYNSVARTFYCKTLSKSPCEGRMQWSEESQKKLPRLHKREKKEERKKMIKGHKIKCSSHKVEAD